MCSGFLIRCPITKISKINHTETFPLVMVEKGKKQTRVIASDVNVSGRDGLEKNTRISTDYIQKSFPDTTTV